MKNNILKKVAGILTHNFGLKLLAVVVSCGLWFVVNSITDPVEKKPFSNIPVEIINEEMVTSEGKVYSPPLPYSVSCPASREVRSRQGCGTSVPHRSRLRFQSPRKQ